MALLPLKDENPLRRIRYPFVRTALVAACVLAFLWQMSLGGDMQRAVFGLGIIPATLTGAARLHPELALVPAFLTPLTSLFLHGNLLHLGGNMLFLWVFGDNVEDAMGHWRFLAFYLLCGVGAGLVHVLMLPDSRVPTIGASGAISGLLGAYIVLHPRAQVLTLLMYFFVYLPAAVVLGLWIALQVFNALADTSGEAGGVAWFAHIGGFVLGALLIGLFKHKDVPLWSRPARKPPRWVGRRRSILPDSGRPRR